MVLEMWKMIELAAGFLIILMKFDSKFIPYKILLKTFFDRGLRSTPNSLRTEQRQHKRIHGAVVGAA